MTHEIDAVFDACVRDFQPSGRGVPDVLDEDGWIQLLDSQFTSRALDLAARELRERGAGFYTIGSSGHESNAAVAAALRPTDPALLHYRSGGFYVQRASQVPGHDAVRDVLLGLIAAADEPVSGGRHKVFGHTKLAVIPQTSTIASHLPRALGLAFSLARSTKLGIRGPWPADAVVVCSFGDASANHSTATGAINAAVQIGMRGLPLPLLMLCEDNGIGISVRTPKNWIEESLGSRVGLKYFFADGSDSEQAVRVSQEAAHWVRMRRKPALLHLRTVRLMGHAGTDFETAYRTKSEISDDMTRDPLLATSQLLIESGLLSVGDVLSRYEAAKARVREVAEEVSSLPRLHSAAAIAAPLQLPDAEDVRASAIVPAPAERRQEVFGSRLPESEEPMTLAQSINRSMLDLMAKHPEVLMFGEDVGAKGGVYGVTRGLQRRMGNARVFDTILDEQTVLGLGLGASLNGLIPIPEIQYLAYLHNAEDQLRGEGATLPFFSAGQYRNPMVVRVAGYGYQKGFGGHFHNDNSVAVLRDMPGVVVASPSRPDDAAAMLRTCVSAGVAGGTLSVFLEPIALYHTRDLHDAGDGGWLERYAAPQHWKDVDVPIGKGRTYGSGRDLTLVSFANGLYMSLRVARQLRRHGIKARVLDLRWLAPLPEADILREARATGRVLIVDETRKSGGVSEAVAAALLDNDFEGFSARVTSSDSYIPLGDAALDVLLSEEEILEAAISLARRRRAVPL